MTVRNEAETDDVKQEKAEEINVSAEEKETPEPVSGPEEKPEEVKHRKKSESRTSRLENELEKANEEIADLKDKYLRKQADFDNFRKRMLREKEESIKYANAALLSDIINVIDDFERALASSGESGDYESLHSGIEIIEKQMISMLETNWGLKRFDSAGEPFNPEKHEALMMEESDEYDTQTVVEDFMKGYTLHDRVIRHAKVKVANPSPAKE